MMAARPGRAVCASPATSEGNPPFVVVVDVGHSIELYSDFSRSGKTYVPFPDATKQPDHPGDLARGDVRKLLHALWTEPMALDPRAGAQESRGKWPIVSPRLRTRWRAPATHPTRSRSS